MLLSSRHTIENVFRILAPRLRTFQQPIGGDIDAVKSIVQAFVHLHNFLQLTTSGFVEAEQADRTFRFVIWRNIVKSDRVECQRK